MERALNGVVSAGLENDKSPHHTRYAVGFFIALFLCFINNAKTFFTTLCYNALLQRSVARLRRSTLY